jgi:hypothetical protein
MGELTLDGRNFFVIGLPRSRTAWFAAWLSDGDSLCQHEAMSGCPSIDHYKSKLGMGGDSSTASMMLDINDLYPDAPILVIERDESHAIRFGIDVMNIDEASSVEIIDNLKQRLDMIDAERVHFDDIDENLEWIWTHLKGTPFDHERAELFKGLNIQVKDPFNYFMPESFGEELSLAIH